MRLVQRAAAALAALLLAALVYVPIVPQQLEMEPDISFRATTHDAFARGLQIGVDIVSTYGPWGLLQRGYDHRTDSVLLIAGAFLAAVFAWGVLRLAFDAGGGALLALAAAATATAAVAAGGFDARFTALGLLLALSALLPESRTRELPLVAALGLIALVKMSLLALALFVVVLVALLRRRPSYAVVFAVAVAIAWFAAGQRLATFPRFLTGGAEVVGGYAGASASGSGVPLAVAGAAGLAVAILFVERSLLTRLLLLGAIAYLAKVGFVRADLVHGNAAGALLLLLSIGYLWLRRDAMPRVRRGVVAAVAVAAAAIVLAAFPLLEERLAADWRWLHDRRAHLVAFERDAARRAGADVVPVVRGTIDSYPWGSAALIARGLHYTPRPVFQSCMAWTPRLADINAAYLRGPRAPEWLWTGVGSIDQRLPILDDAPSWLEMASRYDIAAERAEALLLHRRAAPLAMTSTPIATVNAALRSDIPIPNRGFVWCEIEPHPTLAGRFQDLLGRPSMLSIETVAASGERKRWRAARAQLRGGFLVSPAVTDVAQLARMLRGDASARIAAIRLDGDGLLETVTIRFREISVARTPVPASGTLRRPSSPRTSLPR